MKLGRNKSRYKILVFDNLKKTTKSFVVSDIEDIKSNKELLGLIRDLLIRHYNEKKIKEVEDYEKHIDGLASDLEEEHIEDIAGINKERYN